MPSGKKSKERRRAAQAPPPRTKAAATARRANPAVLAVAGGVFAVLAAVIILVTALAGGNGNSVGPLPADGSLAAGLPGAADVKALFGGIPQRGLTLGRRSAPVTVVEYIDPQCPVCRAFETSVMPALVENFVRTGKVKVEVRVLAFIGPDSARGRDAIIAAAMQNKAFDFTQLLYDNQGMENAGWLDDAMVAQAAKSIPGLNPQRLFDNRQSAEVKSRASTFDVQATDDGVKGTPTLLVGRNAGSLSEVVLRTPTDGSPLVRAIRTVLAARGTT